MEYCCQSALVVVRSHINTVSIDNHQRRSTHDAPNIANHVRQSG